MPKCRRSVQPALLGLPGYRSGQNFIEKWSSEGNLLRKTLLMSFQFAKEPPVFHEHAQDWAFPSLFLSLLGSWRVKTS